MKCPPIPTNCKYFCSNNIQGTFFYLPWPRTPVVRLDKPVDLSIRPIISAVAIEAWYQESNRIWEEGKDESYKEIEKADKNQESWRKWGRGEAWE